MAPVLPPAPRPDSWKELAPPPPPGSSTFSAQASLPKLPVPPLEQTVAKLKESIVPLAWSEEELDAASKKVDAFAMRVGKELQERLLRHAEGKRHWLEKWWDDGGYLGYRDSVIINVSYYYGFKDVPNTSTDHVHRAAALARASMFFRKMLKRGELKPEGTKDTSFCMDTFRWMFDCCRVPGPEGLDWSVSYARPDDLGDSGHIAVVRNGRFWRLDMTQGGQLLSTLDLVRQLQHIVSLSTTPAHGVGVLTASSRDVWAKNYLELASDAHNKTILETIHSAAFVLCLDSSSPADLIAQSRELWHGHFTRRAGGHMGLETRWSDKPINLIVFDNGAAGIMGEHSVMDGTPTVTYCDTILDMLASPSFDHGSPAPAGSLDRPRPLDFNVSEKTRAAIAEARRAASELIEGQSMGVTRTAYGKASIKAFGVSPDSWAQMIIQLAYARLLRSTNAQRVGGTYEAATTRRFLKGRTETIRVVSKDSEAWVKAMDDASKSNAERTELFAAAARTHIRLAKEAGAGQGVDRHMLGLKMMLKESEPMPEVFTDPLVKRSAYWTLSTSAVFSKHFGPYGWGEVVPDGFGVAYMTGFNDYLQYTVTSRTDMPNARFVKEIEHAAEDLYALFGGTKIKAKL
ncbi:acyltransferase ChoActase/COT/CPT [Vararia minispora EC-137]|uniref:Acyltransferase ChoActase/COT/CPT n=1 Tax=Vararia minispora EC-137 TaxID=1314806 RepID=A0ACB8QV66_9AGAM|nr:acyltransferase ChoActase/COT/CPT [Vararia minispora EC-137]